MTKDAGGAYLSPPLGSVPDVYLECGSGQWAYLWARFVNEPEDAKVEQLAFGIDGSPAGPGHVAWYVCDNEEDESIWQKRWDGDPGMFYFNPNGLVAITSHGLRNRPQDQPWNLWLGNSRTALLGAVACRGTPGEMSVSLGVTPICYAGLVPPPGWNEIHVLNKVVCVPEPGGAGAAGGDRGALPAALRHDPKPPVAGLNVTWEQRDEAWAQPSPNPSLRGRGVGRLDQRV